MSTSPSEDPAALGLQAYDESLLQGVDLASTTDEEAVAALTREPEPSPFLGIDYTGDVEEDATAEFDALAQGFRDRMKREQARFLQVVDTGYWTCVCFATAEQHFAFRRALGWDRYGGRYVDGVALARDMGVDIPPSPEFPRTQPPSPTWAERAHTVEDNRALGEIGEEEQR